STGSVPTENSGCWSGLLGNEELDLERITGVSFEFFAGSAVHSLPDSINAGVIALDQMYVSGVRYDLLHSFDSAPSGWNNGAGTSTLLVVADTVEGTGALEFTYDVQGTESWGGSADVQGSPDDGLFPDLTERSHLSLFYKVVEPLQRGAEDDHVRFTFKLFDNSTGSAQEEWHYTTYDVLEDTTGRWQRLLIPLDGFELPSWVPQGDGELNLDSIEEWQFQVLVDGGHSATGKILFDRLTSYGISVVDETPPAEVAGLNVLADDYMNIVMWEDVDGEEGETYDIFYSLSPISDVEAPGVLLAAADVTENTEVFEHRIFHPVVDGDVSFYYAIRAVDAAGNIGSISATGSAIENTAKALPTIAIGGPAAFEADGDLAEWEGIAPFQLRPDGELGHIPTGFGITDEADLSVDVYLAIGADAVYFAMDVTDDTYVPVPEDQNGQRAENAWLYDAAEIYMGLYNEQHPRHAGTRISGDEPDYKFYVYPQRVWSDNREDVVTPGENYYFQPKAGGDGYVVEARLPHENYVHLLDSEANLFQDPVVPVNGMRIPLDIVVMDNDEPGSTNREGILAYSFNNEDDAHGRPRNWFYTWVGDQMVVSSEGGTNELPQRYVLNQNYPNPFNPSTLISYELPQAGHVVVKIFNMLGQEVTTLVDRTENAGKYEVRFDARDLASGVYFYQLQAGSKVMTKKMLLIR
ncbi:MAG: T9SS type A sorting domain-containing protein, partial [Bacteroidota bacterium]